VPPGFPTSAMLRSFQGVLGATDPRNILSEGMKGRFVLKTGVCFCVKILLLCVLLVVCFVLLAGF